MASTLEYLGKKHELQRWKISLKKIQENYCINKEFLRFKQTGECWNIPSKGYDKLLYLYLIPFLIIIIMQAHSAVLHGPEDPTKYLWQEKNHHSKFVIQYPTGDGLVQGRPLSARNSMWSMSS